MGGVAGPHMVVGVRGAGRSRVAARMIMERVAEAFGVMILGSGLFQADAHPGNILVLKGVSASLGHPASQPPLTVDETRSTSARA